MPERLTYIGETAVKGSVSIAYDMGLTEAQTLICGWILVGLGGALALLACVNLLRLCRLVLLEDGSRLHRRDDCKTEGEKEKSHRQSNKPIG